MESVTSKSVVKGIQKSVNTGIKVTMVVKEKQNVTSFMKINKMRGSLNVSDVGIIGHKRIVLLSIR